MTISMAPARTETSGSARREETLSPSIAIVTINFNALSQLRQTVESVFAQTSQASEYILIDGGSSDGSAEFVTDLIEREHFVKGRSAPDRGISDAMNRGLRMAESEWIAFLHAGDRLSDARVLEDVRSHLIRTPRGYVYGMCRIVDREGRQLALMRAPEYSAARLAWRNYIPHPTVYFRRAQLLQLGGYDESLGLAMDYDLWLRASLAGIHGERMDRILADFLVGGASSDLWKTLKEARRARLRHVHQGPIMRGLDYAFTVLRYVKNIPKERAFSAAA